MSEHTDRFRLLDVMLNISILHWNLLTTNISTHWSRELNTDKSFLLGVTVMLKSLIWIFCCRQNVSGKWSTYLQVTTHWQLSIVECDAQYFQLNLHLDLLQANEHTQWSRELPIPTQGQFSVVGSVLKSSNWIFIQICCKWTHPHIVVDIFRFSHTGISRLLVQCLQVPIVSSSNSIESDYIHTLLQLLTDSHILAILCFWFIAQTFQIFLLLNLLKAATSTHCSQKTHQLSHQKKINVETTTHRNNESCPLQFECVSAEIVEKKTD